MKKFAFVLVVFLFAPIVSFAQQTGTDTVTLGTGANTLDVQLSNQVTIVYDGTTTSGDTFAVMTYHDKGTRLYLSSSEDSKIFYNETAIPASAPTITGPAVGSSVDTSGYTAL